MMAYRSDSGTCKINRIVKTFVFDIKTGDFEGQGQRRGSQWIVLTKVYMYVKFERVIIYSFPTMFAFDILKIKVKDKGHSG